MSSASLNQGLRAIGVLLVVGGLAGTIWAGSIGQPWLAGGLFLQGVVGCVWLWATAAAFDNLLAIRKELERGPDRAGQGT